MKKISLLLVAALSLTLGSCSNDGPLTVSSAKVALKKEALFGKDNIAKSFTLGFYEASESTLQNLAKLKAAGVITMEAEKVVEHVERRKWNYWNSYIVTEDVNHYFVNVSMTEEGQKYVVEAPAKLRKDLVEDMKANENLEEVMPAYMSETFAVEGNTETAEVEEAVEEVPADTVAEPAAEEQPSTVVKPAVDPNAAYKAAQARVKTEEVYVRLGRYELVKVKEVKCTEDMYKAGTGTARFFTRFVDKTPFGFVAKMPAEGYVSSGTATFTLYQDMGWLVNDFKD